MVGGGKRKHGGGKVAALIALAILAHGCAAIMPRDPVAPATPKQAVATAYAAIELAATETAILVDAGTISKAEAGDVRAALFIALSWVDQARRIEASGGDPAEVSRMLDLAAAQLAVARAKLPQKGGGI